MDYLQFASQALVSGVGIAGLALSAFHVKNANAVASDAVATLSDAITAMHGNLSGIVSRLATASPTLLADGMKLAGDLGAGPQAAGAGGMTAPGAIVAEALTIARKS